MTKKVHGYFYAIYMHICICMYVHIASIHMHTNMCVYMCVCARVWMCMYVCAHVWYVWACVCMCVYVLCVCMCVHTWVCVCAHALTNIVTCTSVSSPVHCSLSCIKLCSLSTKQCSLNVSSSLKVSTSS